MENLIGNIVEVIVSKNGKVASKNLKVCKVNSSSVLFIEVDRENRKNIFRKFKVTDVENVGSKTDGGEFVLIRDGILPDKWESNWDGIGTFSPSVQSYGRFAKASKPGNHSQSLNRSTPSYNYGGGAHFRT